jgi:hypothetical protein
VVREPTAAYYQDGGLAWIAQPDEWYRVVTLDAAQRWMLAYREGDDASQRVWIAADHRIESVIIERPGALPSELPAFEPPLVLPAPEAFDPPPPAATPVPPMEAAPTPTSITPTAAVPTATPVPNTPVPETPVPETPVPATPLPVAGNLPSSCSDRVLSVPSQVTVGREVPFRATGFKPGTMVAIDIVGVQGSHMVPGSVFADGNCEARATVRTLSTDRLGRYTIRARGESPLGGQTTTTAIFEIVPSR